VGAAGSTAPPPLSTTGDALGEAVLLPRFRPLSSGEAAGEAVGMVVAPAPRPWSSGEAVGEAVVLPFPAWSSGEAVVRAASSAPRPWSSGEALGTATGETASSAPRP
jgi:hypothetical protein